MRQIFLNNIKKNSLLKIKEEYHHLINVCRLKNNDFIKIVFKDHTSYIYKVSDVIKNEKTILLKLIKEIKEYNIFTNNYEINIGFSSLKSQKNELVIQKTTELDVNNIFIINTDNSVKKIKDGSTKKERYKKIILESSKQCNRINIPSIKILKDINSYFELIRDDSILIVCDEFMDYTNNIKKYFNLIKNYKKVFYLIGPEGGYSLKEREIFKKYKYDIIFCSLGKNILRAETACISMQTLLYFNKF